MEINQLINRVYEEVINRTIEKENKDKAVVIGTVDDALVKKIDKQFDWTYFNANEIIADLDAVVITEISISMLAHLANGIPHTEEDKLILTMLFKNKQVIAVKDGFEFFQFQNSAAHSLYELYETYYYKLISFGLQIDVQQNDDISKKSSSTSKEPSIYTELNKKVITENDLQKLFLKKVSNVCIPTSSILTPLATDYIRKHNIKISQVKGE